MRVLVVGTHQAVYQPSMKLYAQWLVEACEPLGDVSSCAAPTIFFNAFTQSLRFSKWLHYIDQYVILTLILAFKQFNYDAILVADHSNSPSTLLVFRKILFAMVHDTIAIRQAFGQVQITGAPATRQSGRLLQKLIVSALRRCRALISNPEPVPTQCRQLGITRHIEDVGCPFDARRFSHEGISPSGDFRNLAYVLNVGSDSRRKRKSDLLKLWRHVEDRNSEVWLVLAGTTGKASLRLIDTLGLQRVIVVEKASDSNLAELYRSCQALAVSSEHEGFCIPVLEAAAFGKRVFTPKDVPFFSTVFGQGIRPMLTFDEGGASNLVCELSRNLTSDEAQAQEALLLKYSKASFGMRVRRVLCDSF